jgi:hypothetical protein
VQWVILLLAVTVIILWVFLPDMLPLCGVCGKKKPRPFFRIHTTVSVGPGYRGKKSACRKCCRKYGLWSVQDLTLLQKARRKAKWNK